MQVYDIFENGGLRMKTLNEVCEIVGLSRRMIQEYESFGLAKTPKTTNKYGHLLYSEEDIERLWQLRFYKELGYRKREIKEIYSVPDYDKQKSLETQIQLLEKKKKELENLIEVAKAMGTMGIRTISCKYNIVRTGYLPFDVTLSILGSIIKNSFFESELEELLNDTLNESDADLWFDNMEKILVLDEEICIMNKKVQNLVQNLYTITSPILSPSITIFGIVHISLISNTQFVKWVDEVFGNNKSNYLLEAIHIFIDNNQNNSYDQRLICHLDNIAKFGIEKYTIRAEEVQAEVKEIHNLVKQIKILNEKGQIYCLSLLGEIFRADEYKKIINNEMGMGVAGFIFESIEIYIENIMGGNTGE